MTEIPEEQQAAALRAVIAAADARDQAQAELDARTKELAEASVEATRVGAVRTRIRRYAKVSSKTYYAWLAAAGIDVGRGG